MKKGTTMIRTILMTFLFLLQAGTALAASQEGRIDGITGNAIYGWAWDHTNQGSPVEVKVVVKKLGTSDMIQETIVTANQYRDDLSAAGKGSGNYSFVVDMDWSKLENIPYIVEAYVGNDPLPNTLRYENGQVTPATPQARAASGNLVSLGVFKTTAYCPCYSCSEGWGRQTSTGALASASHTIAVDPKVIPYGSKVMINGVIYTAEDRGGGVKGKHIDIFYNTHAETRQHGLQSAEVFLVS